MGLIPLGAILVLLVVLGPFAVLWYFGVRGLLARTISKAPVHGSTIHNWSLLIAVLATLTVVVIAVYFKGRPFISNAGLVVAVCAMALAWSAFFVPKDHHRDGRLSRLFGYCLIAGGIGVLSGAVAEWLLRILLADG